MNIIEIWGLYKWSIITLMVIFSLWVVTIWRDRKNTNKEKSDYDLLMEKRDLSYHTYVKAIQDYANAEKELSEFIKKQNGEHN